MPETGAAKDTWPARDAWEMEFLIGSEVEFLVVKNCNTTKKLIPHSKGAGHFAVSGLRDETFQYVAHCVHILRDQGVLFDDFHTEGGRGQYVIALSPLPPNQAVDQLVLRTEYGGPYPKSVPKGPTFRRNLDNIPANLYGLLTDARQHMVFSSQRLQDA